MATREWDTFVLHGIHYWVQFENVNFFLLEEYKMLSKYVWLSNKTRIYEDMDTILGFEKKW